MKIVQNSSKEVVSVDDITIYHTYIARIGSKYLVLVRMKKEDGSGQYSFSNLNRLAEEHYTVVFDSDHQENAAFRNIIKDMMLRGYEIFQFESLSYFALAMKAGKL